MKGRKLHEMNHNILCEQAMYSMNQGSMMSVGQFAVPTSESIVQIPQNTV